jgi:Trk K+ transport system NAD-binding subunit
MPVPRLERVPRRPLRHGAGSRLWAEWCFFRVCLAHVRVRLLLMLLILLTGAALFLWLEPGKGHTTAQSIYYTFSLIFGETPEAFPTSPLLQVVFFVVPILGLTIIIEGIVDFSLVLRDRQRFERRWCKMLASSFRHHVILVGLDRLGYRTFRALREMDTPVVVLTLDDDNQFLEEVRRDGSPLLLGDARQEVMLQEANVARARCVVIATGDDLANLEIALDARALNPDVRVVVRMFDQNMADKVADGFNIQLALSPSAISAQTFAACAVAPNTVNSFEVDGTMLATQRWLVRRGGDLAGRTVAELMRDLRIGVVEHHRAGGPRTICPSPDTRLEPGDGLMVQGPVDRLEKLRARTVARIEATEAGA